jgi:hypothetical protein
MYILPYESIRYYLVDYFPYIGNVIIPTDELIFLRGVGIPPTIYIYIHTHDMFIAKLY